MTARESRTTYFLGAGASAADGMPVTWQLNYGIASFLSDGTSGHALRLFYKMAFGVGLRPIRASAQIWGEYLTGTGALQGPSGLPDLIETLSVLDVCIGEGRSLGPGKVNSKAPSEELSNSLLRTARSDLVDALRLTIVQVIAKRGRYATTTKAFINSLKSTDSIVTTNWDYLVEKILAKSQKRLDGRWLKTRNMSFGCVKERAVDWRGKDLQKVAGTVRSIYKLHGGVNWYLCERCQNLYINVEYTPASLGALTKDSGGCHCGAELSGLLVAPSYLKDYNNAHLRSVWLNAQKALEASEKWVFIGYSLPQDDYHIRALLLRALCVRRARKRSKDTRVVVVTQIGKDPAKTEEMLSRYRAFFCLERLEPMDRGFETYSSEMA